VSTPGAGTPPGGSAGASLRQAVEAILDATPGAAAGRTVVALGWATVDADRAAAELIERWPGCGPFVPVAPEILLGASCHAGRPITEGGLVVGLVLLEPSTEGRLAATLARHDEGPAVLWLADTSAPRAPDADDRGLVSVTAEGPFGPERLLLRGRVAGPHLLLLERPASTIDR
jgi:hypothetical protein